jgi:hypothetical protein
MERLDKSLRPPPVAYGPACRHQSAREGGLSDEPAGPQLLEELFFGHDPVAVLEEISQEIEYLRLELDQLAGRAQLIAPWVELILLKGIDHPPCPPPPDGEPIPLPHTVRSATAAASREPRIGTGACPFQAPSAPIIADSPGRCPADSLPTAQEFFRKSP